MREGEYLVVEGEKCADFYRALPQEYAGQPVTDFGRALVLPAFCDLHLPRPPDGEPGRGLRPGAAALAGDLHLPGGGPLRRRGLCRGGVEAVPQPDVGQRHLRFSAFATIHKEAAWRLMELTERAGLSALIGKVNMDRNAPDSLREDTDAPWRTRRSSSAAAGRS